MYHGGLCICRTPSPSTPACSIAHCCTVDAPSRRGQTDWLGHPHISSMRPFAPSAQQHRQQHPHYPITNTNTPIVLPPPLPYTSEREPSTTSLAPGHVDDGSYASAPSAHQRLPPTLSYRLPRVCTAGVSCRRPTCAGITNSIRSLVYGWYLRLGPPACL